MCPLLFSESSHKSRQSHLSPQFPSELCPAWLVSKFQILGTPMAWSHAVTPKECLTSLLPFAGPIPGKWLHDHAVVLSLWQHKAERWHLDSLFSARFHAPMPGNSASPRCHLFLHPRGSSEHNATSEILPHFAN